MMLSVLLPTRERVDRLHRTLASLYETVSDPANVEVITRTDLDDQRTLDYLADRSHIKNVCGPRVGYAKVGQMMNECLAIASGQLLFAANDDLIFETRDWDLLLKQAASEYPDGIFNLAVDTVLNNENCCFPCVSRRLVEALGCFYDERLFYPDIWLRDAVASFGRLIRVPNVTIRHAWEGMTPDQETAMRATLFNPDYPTLYARCVDEARKKVAAAMATELV